MKPQRDTMAHSPWHTHQMAEKNSHADLWLAWVQPSHWRGDKATCDLSPQPCASLAQSPHGPTDALQLLPEQAAGGRSRLSDSVRGQRAPGDVTERAQRIGSWGETLTEMTDAPEGSRCANLWHSQEPFKHHWAAALEPQRLENGLVSRQCRVKAGGAGSRPLVTCSPEGRCCPEDQTSYIHCWFTNLKLFQQEASCRSI